MASIDDEIARLRRAREILENAIESMSDEIAVSTLTLLKDRSINEGITIGGEPGSKAQYSKKEIKTSLFAGKERNKAGTAWIEANTVGTWHQFRKAQGLNNEEVNLSYTNEMWSKIGVIKTNVQGQGRASTEIGSLDEETQNKIEGNSYRFGDFLKPLPEELEFGQSVLKQKIDKLLRQ